MKLHWIFNRYMGPAGDEGSTGGGAVDRGDDFTPTDDTEGTKPESKEADTSDEKKAEETEEKSEEDHEDDEDEEKPKKKKADSRIPLARHKEILEKERAERKALEAQLSQFQQGKQVADINAELTASETKLLGMEKEYAKLLTDGEIEKAANLMSDIRRLEREMSEQKSDMKIAAAEARATERARYNIALERVEGAYPQLNPDHDDFDGELLTDVADLKATYERKGMTPTDALQKAVKKLVGTETKKQEAATEVTPTVKTSDVAAERKKEAVAKALDAAKKTPPNASKLGMDHDKDGGTISAKDVMKMNFKDFSALSEETLARMRGDVL